MNRRQLLAATLAGSNLVARPRMLRAESYPSKPITLLVGGAPGSPPDLVARTIAQRLGDALGRTVVVANKPGAAGSIAMAALVAGVPDGHTLALATMSQAVFNK